MSDIVTSERNGSVEIITLDDGRANALSVATSVALSEALAAATGDAEVGAVVLVGRDGLFSGGFDLKTIQSGDPNAIREMTDRGGSLCHQIYAGPVPVVAACTGHAVAAGALMVLACDLRIGVDGPVKIGLNEVAIALTLPPWALALALDRLSRRHLQTSVALAQLHDGPGAVDAGYLDAVVPADEVVGHAIERAAELAEYTDRQAYAATVAAIRAPALAAMAV
ncbi:MAG: crotonase/enoyl-CoA hydratase family protein [Actinomycetia bacterium]|nr:crotonase/enoyl-CoA hydratase family protein [Actinomycetes bacterium]